MSELERALQQLGRELEFPQEPDLRGRVRGRIERRRRLLHTLVFAVALVAVAFGIALAVPQARSAILRFFHIGAVTIEQVDTLPAAQERPLAAGLGSPLSLDAAEELSGVPLVLHGPRPRNYYARPGLIATLLRVEDTPVLLAELAGDQVGIVKKLVPGTSRVEPAEIGDFGLYVTGGRHVLYWREGELRPRLAGNVLIWLEGGRTYRLEGDLNKGRLLRLARDITR